MRCEKYDLVILGVTLEAVKIAEIFTQFYPRKAVAIITQNQSLLAHIEVSLVPPIIHAFPVDEKLLSKAIEWLEMTRDTLKEKYSFGVLATWGVTVIEGEFEFINLAKKEGKVKDRMIRSNQYFITTSPVSFVPDCLSLVESGYETLESISHPSRLEKLPQNLIMLGGRIESLAWCQSLQKLGKNVTLVIETRHLFPQEDQDIIQLLIAQLEAEGIKIITGSPLSQVREINGKKWLQVGDFAVETDEIILSIDLENPLTQFNLSFPLVEEHSFIHLIPSLVTINDDCHSLFNLVFPLIKEYDSKSFFYRIVSWIRRIQKNYFNQLSPNLTSFIISSYPPLCRVGLTEKQAKKQFKGKVEVITKVLRTLIPNAQGEETINYYKFILNPKGQLVGVYYFGENAALISIIMREKIIAKKRFHPNE